MLNRAVLSGLRSGFPDRSSGIDDSFDSFQIPITQDGRKNRVFLENGACRRVG